MKHNPENNKALCLIAKLGYWIFWVAVASVLASGVVSIVLSGWRAVFVLLGAVCAIIVFVWASDYKENC